jgi:hypothetical protein
MTQGEPVRVMQLEVVASETSFSFALGPEGSGTIHA